jgi:hypothetical protein
MSQAFAPTWGWSNAHHQTLPHSKMAKKIILIFEFLFITKHNFLIVENNFTYAKDIFSFYGRLVISDNHNADPEVDVSLSEPKYTIWLFGYQAVFGDGHVCPIPPFLGALVYL